MNIQFIYPIDRRKKNKTKQNGVLFVIINNIENGKFRNEIWEGERKN
jgi:hypothetical protein